MLLLLPPLSLPKTQSPDLELWNPRAFQQFQEPAESTEERQRQLDWMAPFVFGARFMFFIKIEFGKIERALKTLLQ